MQMQYVKLNTHIFADLIKPKNQPVHGIKMQIFISM